MTVTNKHMLHGFKIKPGMVVHSYNTNTPELKGEEGLCKFKSSLGYIFNLKPAVGTQ